jgi:hypothetical protein
MTSALLLDVGRPGALRLVGEQAVRQLRRRLTLVRAAGLLAQFVRPPVPIAVNELMEAVAALERAMSAIEDTLDAFVASGAEPGESKCESELTAVVSAEKRLELAVADVVTSMPAQSGSPS